MTATSRLAAIMVIDVVGYSRLMGEDDAGTAPACASIARRRGRSWRGSEAVSSRRWATGC